MESRAHFLAIGAFTLLGLVMTVAFILWVAKVDVDQDFTTYDIYFDTPVTGVSRGGDVRYNGILVGKVRRLSIDEKNPRRVKLQVRIYEGTPIKQDTEATIDVLGFTGVAFVQLKGGSPDSPFLTTLPGQEFPVIPATSGGLQALLEKAPDLLTAGTHLIERAMLLLTDENITSIAKSIKNVETVTSGIAGETENLRQSIASIATTLKNIETASADLPGALSSVRTGAKSFQNLAENLDGMITDNRAAIGNFTATTLPEVSQMAVEARRLAASLSRIAEQIERDPAKFFFAQQKPEVPAQ